MAKLTRVFQKIFGSTAGASEMGVFGSFAAGSPANSSDPATIQSLSNFLDGWFSAVVGENSPSMEDMNAAFFLAYRQLAYLFQAGVAEYDATTAYYIGSMVNSAGVIYVSLTDNNTGNAVSSLANWRPYQPVTSVQTKTANYTTLITDGLVTGNATGGAFTLTLVTTGVPTGTETVLAKDYLDVSMNAITIAPNLSGASRKLFMPGESVRLRWNGASWQVLEHYIPPGPTAVTLTAPANTFGTLTAQTTWMEREGRFARFYGRLRIGTVASGTPSALLLPTGIAIDPAYIAGADTVELGRFQRIANAAGSTPINNADAAFVGFTDNANTDRIVISNITGSAQFSNRNSNADWSNNDYMTFNFKIPVLDWWG